ncbi:unnamed protein product [Rotaria socialis]|uniref:Uncharacterized protein n=1 Tax=Rotaria socialis TaxID=392032 RepID=A0A820SQP6_9BILA|nr:unnamed protein product [Rotaria socialis]CAF3375300.1 unnamed protein product [Rotaria socialis]CAF3569464.1 unnamed protein product [Rotaria socialis]CAF4278487.1 unnamed protein product [Rotaria socialis]CAF4441153.1 unnamed protein product [Rotaria socialis]
MLFKELCLVYIAIGLALVEYDKRRKIDIINRFNEIEKAVEEFKETAVNQRISMFGRYVYEDVEYTDKLRDDMKLLSIHMPEFMTPMQERLMHTKDKQFNKAIKNQFFILLQTL